MSNSKDKMNRVPPPPLTEIETLLSQTKPRPTARLQRLMNDAPWQTQGRELNMKRLRRLEIIATGTAILLLAVIAAVFFLEWSPAADSINNLGTGAETAADAIPTRPTEPVEQAEPTEQAEPVEAAEMVWMTTWPIEAGEERLSATGMAYGEVDGNGRLFVANGYQGIQRFSKTGEDLGPISIVDPETGQAVFVRDVVWSPLLWLAPPEYGLIALTDPFESGAYLHIVDPDQGAILRSFEINSNIALPVNATTITATVPTQLATTGTGEIYTDRLYAFPNDSAPDEPNALHYLLRMTLEGRILNSFLIAGQPSMNELPGIVAALTYQPVTDQVVAAVHQGDNGRIDKYNLVRTPQHLVTLDEELIGCRKMLPSRPMTRALYIFWLIILVI